MNETLRLSSHPFCVAMAEQRQRYGYSLQKLADRIGCVSRSYLKDIESGRCNVSMDIGMMICQSLDIPVYFCLDYIKQFNSLRMEHKIRKEYQEWLDLVPHEVLDSMMQNSESLRYHNQMTEGWS